MKAVLFQSKNQPLRVAQIATPSLTNNEVLVRLHYAAMNHLDLWNWKEINSEQPVIPGSDGSGIVQAVGDGVNNEMIGKEVIINPGLYWGTNEKIHGADFQILGYPTNGTFAEYIVIPKEYVYPIPAHLSLREAAALPLAVLTAYRALFTKAKLTASDTVLITGIGGGAAISVLQIAVAAGATVYVTSSSGEKIQKAKSLGAKGGFSYKDQNWVELAKKEAGGFDVIVDSAAGNGFVQLIDVANPAARIISFGRTAGNINDLKPGPIYNKQLEIKGTLMGTPNEFKEMLQFYEQKQLRPVIDKEFSLDDVNKAYHYMENRNHFGKIVFSIH